jgi:cytochrome P450
LSEDELDAGAVSIADVPTPGLAQDAMVAIVAGSDTSATALANALYFLLTTPGAYDRLRAEVNAASAVINAREGQLDWAHLVDLPYMQAVINETLRLAPAVPGGAQRTPPPDGGPVAIAGQ